MNATGSGNVALGKGTGAARNSYNNATFIGVNADATVTGLSNVMALGYGASVDASNKVSVGNTSVTSIGGQVGWTTFSDRRLKQNIEESKLGLDFVMNLHPVIPIIFPE